MNNKILVAILSSLFALQLHAAQVTVFAAASLTDSLKQIAADYEKSSGDKIVFNFAASGTLSRQIGGRAGGCFLCRRRDEGGCAGEKRAAR